MQTDGWVQQISRRAVVAATPPGVVIRIETRPGAYLVAGEPIVTIWPAAGSSFTAREAGHVAALIREAVVIGYARTMQQDIDFGLRQLNDIALRALSPAVNDPTTAIEVVLRLSSVLRPLVQADLPDQSVWAGERRILLTPWDLDHAEYVTHAFAQLRVYAAPHPQVALALVRAMRMLRSASRHADANRALDRQLELTSPRVNGRRCTRPTSTTSARPPPPARSGSGPEASAGDDHPVGGDTDRDGTSE